MTMGGAQRGRKEFKVVVDADLGDATLQRLEKAIQKAVLLELADTDVADGYSVLFRGDEGEAAIGGHQTDGIVMRRSAEL
jgi:hypothetical protein